MQDKDFKQAMASYRKGFLVGAFLGVVLCLVIGKAFLTLPLVLALLFGAIGFDLTQRKNESGHTE